ncbi:hypothetical protein [Virgibacillus sp. YIM 98842]|uniref:hypothetical protein n=1 Tax=Virgibacillus sp. YIM 98842 TaxID=2663533 RepID=UPI0013DBC6D7|nr:hypothetical protein [Virgibacillus sp. YIM 98842]
MRPIRAHDMQEDIMINHIVEELNNRFNYHDTEGKSLRELKYKLAAFRAMEVEA